MLIQPYLTFNGNCRQAFEHYHKVLGGTMPAMQAFGGSPGSESMPKDFQDKIMHVRLEVGDQALMGSDAPPEYQEQMGGFSVSIQADDAAQAEEVFAGLSEGGMVTLPLQETFWAPKFGMCKDKFGVAWMVNLPHK